MSQCLQYTNVSLSQNIMYIPYHINDVYCAWFVQKSIVLESIWLIVDVTEMSIWEMYLLSTSQNNMYIYSNVYIGFTKTMTIKA